MMCDICRQRPADVSGWGAEWCAECAVRDGWIYLDMATGTVCGVPRAEWAPTPEQVAEFAANLRMDLAEATAP